MKKGEKRGEKRIVERRTERKGWERVIRIEVKSRTVVILCYVI